MICFLIGASLFNSNRVNFVNNQKNSLVLSISHAIYLTREQRYQLVNGESLEVVGVSTPVWYSKEKTTEPGKEVFVRYLIHNKKELDDTVVEINVDGYEFNLKQINPDDMVWVDKEKNHQEPPPNANYLKDVTDGGSEGLTMSRVAFAKMRKVPTKIYHTVRIKDMKYLESSLVKPSDSPSESSPSED